MKNISPSPLHTGEPLGKIGWQEDSLHARPNCLKHHARTDTTFQIGFLLRELIVTMYVSSLPHPPSPTRPPASSASPFLPPSILLSFFAESPFLIYSSGYSSLYLFCPSYNPFPTSSSPSRSTFLLCYDMFPLRTQTKPIPTPNKTPTHRIISLPPKITNKYVPIAVTTSLFVLIGDFPGTQVIYSIDGLGKLRVDHVFVIKE